MKKKTLRLEKLSLQKTILASLSSKAQLAVKGGESWDGCAIQVSLPGGALSCIGHTCESWVTEDPSCRTCAEM